METFFQIFDKLSPLVYLLIGIYLSPYVQGRLEKKNKRTLLKLEIVQNLVKIHNYMGLLANTMNQTRLYQRYYLIILKIFGQMPYTDPARNDTEKRLNEYSRLTTENRDATRAHNEKIIDFESELNAQIIALRNLYGTKVYADLREHLKSVKLLVNTKPLLHKYEVFNLDQCNETMLILNDEIDKHCLNLMLKCEELTEYIDLKLKP